MRNSQGQREEAIDANRSFFGPIVSLGEADVHDMLGDDWLEFLGGLRRGVVGFRDHFRAEARAESAHARHIRAGPKVGRRWDEGGPK